MAIPLLSSLDVSWQQILAMEIIPLPLPAVLGEPSTALHSLAQ
jgi:hypothetical protein